ncbi:MAG: hypothetical protein NWE98_05345 [Candidatus Bathyarchaeota archaeon]|nr:hypothetical protein [Candidatus Bathyarchaeota archaeon]
MLSSTMILQVGADVVGVSQGDVFQYDRLAHLTLLVPTSDPTPPSLLEVNQTKLISVTVVNVTGTTIFTDVRTTYKNGTETHGTGFCDIDTGECNSLPFIGANLKKGDAVNPLLTDPWHINDTVSRTYKSGTRETNYLKIQSTENIQDLGDVTLTYEYYFDKATGVLVDYRTEVANSQLISVTESKLVASNLWEVGNQQIETHGSALGSTTTPYVAAAVTAIVIIIIAVIILKRRKTKDEPLEEEQKPQENTLKKPVKKAPKAPAAQTRKPKTSSKASVNA